MSATDSGMKIIYAGSGKTLEELQTAVYRYCLSLTRSSWDAEDLAQDTWLKAIGTLGERGHANPEALLIRIAKTTWIDQSRRKQALKRILHNVTADSAATGKEPFPLELEETFRAVLKVLSPLQRSVWMLREIWDYSAKETAELLQTSEGAVKSALHRARELLREVRTELEEGRSSPASDREAAGQLAAMAAAYRAGNVAALLRLLRGEALAEAAALPDVHSRTLHGSGRPQPQRAVVRSAAPSGLLLRMAA